VIAELGHYALVLALGLAVVQGTLPFWGAARRDPALMGLAPAAAVGQLVGISIAFAALTWLYVVSDFSVLNVYQNSHSSKPLLYKVTGVWGNHEGSLVLWVWILALFGAAVAVFGRNLPPTFRARVLGMQALIGVGFLLFTLSTSNPFERLDPVPLDGRGLNPILQDPGLAFHPPMLYVGYVGFSMAYAFAMAALLEGRVDAAWARWVRPWTLAAWVALTLGIALGSLWAYYELGWGGWWFWDPVENASFMPWLAGTALLHSAIVVEKRDALKSWTILLAIVTFSLSLLGTFLVRSGVLTSVHAFAVDPDRGVFILAMLIVAIGGSLLLYAWRAPQLQGGGLFAPVSREGALLLNNLLLATACATVLLGTLYPLLLEAVGGPMISVGPPFFNATFVPLMVPLLLALPLGTMMAWKRGDLAGVLGRLWAAAAISAVAALMIYALHDLAGVLSALAVGLGVWVIAGTLVDLAGRVQLLRLPPARSWQRARGLPRASWGMVLAHLGLGVMILGMTAASAWKQETIAAMQPGDRATVAGYEFRLAEVKEVTGPNWISRRGVFEVSRGGRDLGIMRSERRFYPVESMPTTQVGLRIGLMRDLYVVFGERLESGGYSVRLHYNPMVAWLWLGALMMGVGGMVSLSDRRLRVGAPTPARERPAAQPAKA
jgi:cytochrome c-type biogenesis protein CcmF